MPCSDLADSTPRIESDPEESLTAHTRSRHTLHNLLHHYTPTFTNIPTKCSLFPGRYSTLPSCALWQYWTRLHVPFGPFLLQWNLSIKDTTRTQLTVLHREVSLIQR